MVTRHRYLNNDDRPDIIIFDTGNLSDLEIDVSLAHPWSKEVIRNSARQAGYAAKKREQVKNAKYNSEILPGGRAPNCIPAVFEHFGTWGTAADQFLNTLSSRSRDEEGLTSGHIGDVDFQYSYKNSMPMSL